MATENVANAAAHSGPTQGEYIVHHLTHLNSTGEAQKSIVDWSVINLDSFVFSTALGIITVLKPTLGYKLCAEIAREGYETGKSLHDIVVKERKLLTQEKWDEVFSFENLVSPKFEQ